MTATAPKIDPHTGERIFDLEWHLAYMQDEATRLLCRVAGLVGILNDRDGYDRSEWVGLPEKLNEALEDFGDAEAAFADAVDELRVYERSTDDPWFLK